MSFQDGTLFGRQLAKSNFHSSRSWHRELEIAKALKIAQDDENIDDEAIGLEKLGDVYAERGLEEEALTTFRRLDQLILATALYNSCLVRATSPVKKGELKAKLRRLEEDVINLCGQSINASAFHYDVDRDHKKELEQFRECCREKLDSIQSEFTVFVSPLHDTDAASEERRARAIEQLFIEIQAFVKEFVSRLLDECVKVLGPAPEGVNYAFIGFGSFPRGEVTPFSDLESALLVEEDRNSPSVKEYFVRLTEYFNFKVLNLQETILPSMCIPSLNDLNDEISSLERYKCTATTCTRREHDENQVDSQEDSSLSEDRDWFYDNQMRGFSVDGRMSKACKTPLGRLVQGRGRTEDLIKTPTGLAELYVKSLEHDRFTPERKDNNYNLSSVLSNVSFLYGNDQSLVDTYDAVVLSMTEAVEGNAELNARQVSAVGCLQKTLEEFQFSLNASDIGLISSIKKKFYRVVDLLVMDLGKFQYPGVVDNSPWEIVRRFREAGVISPAGLHNLTVVVGIVNEVRLMAYLRSGRQDELFSFFSQSTDINYELTKNLFVRFFYTVFPFQRAVKNLLSHLTESNAVGDILFLPKEQFYEYSHLTSAVALSLTSYRFFLETMDKFMLALQSAEDESSQRLCLAFLSCLHPDFSTQFCNKLLACSEDEKNVEWRICSFLIASLASFHQNNIDNVEKFLHAAARERSRIQTSGGSTRDRHLGAEMVVQSYESLVRGLLMVRKKRYEVALDKFKEAGEFYKTNTQSKGAKASLFTTCCIFMIGRSHMHLGNLQDSSIERAMRMGRNYVGNGQYMRILYHAYLGMVCLQNREQDDEVAKHCEKVLELFLRFQCPQGQNLWASIPAQSVILVALYLGLFYREAGRVKDALRVFQTASTRLIWKALEFCNEEHHVGQKSAETARQCVDAFKAVFKLLEAECFHFEGRDQDMWTCLGEAVNLLANYRGKFKPIELRDVFAAGSSRQFPRPRVNGDPTVWQTNVDSMPPTSSRVVDTFTMAPLLEAWCDTLTMGMQYTLYTTEQDIYGQLMEKGTPLILPFAILLSNFDLLAQFQSNPYEVVSRLIPALRQDSNIGQVVGGIFAGIHSQRKAVLELIRKNVAGCERFAVEFTDDWIEVLLLYLRVSLCHDLVSAYGFFK